MNPSLQTIHTVFVRTEGAIRLCEKSTTRGQEQFGSLKGISAPVLTSSTMKSCLGYCARRSTTEGFSISSMNFSKQGIWRTGPSMQRQVAPHKEASSVQSLPTSTLDTLDTYVETVLIPQHTRGKVRARNAEYRRLVHRAEYLRTQGKMAQAQELKKQAQHLPSRDPLDPHFRRLRYVRYADDFLLGFSGPKEEAEEIKQQVEVFLREELKLELSQAKTLITHARSENSRKRNQYYPG